MKYILLIKYIKSVHWRVAKCLSYIEEARCLKVKGSEEDAEPVSKIGQPSINSIFKNLTNFDSETATKKQNLRGYK